MLTLEHINESKRRYITKDSKSRQARNNFRPATISEQTKKTGAYALGYGRNKDIRYKIVQVRDNVATYIGLSTEHPAYGAKLDTLREMYPNVDWSYSSAVLMHSKRSSEQLWWIGWVSEEKEPKLADVNDKAKLVINEIAKGALSGEIGPNH